MAQNPSKVDRWLQRGTPRVRKALESASRYFDSNDELTVNTWFGKRTMLSEGLQTIPTKKLIVLGLESDDAGRVVAPLVFEDGSHPFLLWMDEQGDGRYELRRMAELPGFLSEEFVRQLHDPAYRQYGL